MRVTRFILTICVLLFFAGAVPAFAQEHGSPQPPPPAHGAATPQGEQAHAEAGEEHAEGIMPTVWKLLNFAILVGVLVYFLKSPLVAHLASRISQIRQDLVAAADLKKTATEKLAEIGQKMAALPGELDALRRQGAEDVKAERERIAKAAETERVRLLDQTRREIDMRLRVAKRELTEHAAQLAVQVAEQRIKRVITPDDQMRLVDRYASQLKEAR
jgi:F-type H+-transporting ATPase subunit b